MLQCLPWYNPILIDATSISIMSGIHLRVLHIPGDLNCVADVISCKKFLLAQQYIPGTTISSFLPPQLLLRAPQKWSHLLCIPGNLCDNPGHVTCECLFQEQAIALGQAIDNSTWKNYSSALNSYLNFVKIHNFPLNPTLETLSLFTVYMSHHIKPYLSGICQQLEPYFPNVHSARNSALVHCTLQGCRWLHAIPTCCKCALTLGNLETVINSLNNSNDYDNHHFLAQLLTGFFALVCLGKMTYPDEPKLCDPRKVTRHNSVWLCHSSFQFFLPDHKANRLFEGNIIIVCKNQHTFDPHKYFTAYLRACDEKFPLSSPLWLTSKGAIPTCSFFIKHLQHSFSSDMAGQSLWAGSATSLVENGVSPSIIQVISRWASDTFKIYIQKKPILIQALLFGQTACLQSSFIHALDS